MDVDTLTVEDSPVTTPPAATRRKGVRGRAAFSDKCVHGGTPDTPCPKFGHLPGNGRGVKQPGIAKTVAGVLRAVIKPFVWIAVVYLAGNLLLGWIGSSLRFANPLQQPVGGVSTDNRPAQNGSLPASSGSIAGLPAVSDPRPYASHLSVRVA